MSSLNCQRAPKLVIFDLDGVLVSSRDLHWEAFRAAIAEVAPPQCRLTKDEHTARYDGLPTTAKLQLLSKDKGLPKDLHQRLWQAKQDHTRAAIPRAIRRDDRLRHELKAMRRVWPKTKFYCASNCIAASIILLLRAADIIDCFDFMLSQEDVSRCKPAPSIYLACMQREGVSPLETLVVEDSPVGRRAARSSGAHLVPVAEPADVSLALIKSHWSRVLPRVMADLSTEVAVSQQWQHELNVVIPMAGRGSRFAKAGYTFPKPLIEIEGRPMIEVVAKNLGLGPKTHVIFIVQKNHADEYALRDTLERIAAPARVSMIELDGVTDGAARTVLMAKNLINSDTPLLTANSDQFLEWEPCAFLYKVSAEGIDGAISTFGPTCHPKWSFAKTNEAGWVTEVAEKRAISNKATTGIYYWKRGSDFVSCAEAMISKNIRTNGEFYVCPVFNEAVERGLKVCTVDCHRMWGLGTPEDLSVYLCRAGVGAGVGVGVGAAAK